MAIQRTYSNTAAQLSYPDATSIEPEIYGEVATGLRALNYSGDPKIFFTESVIAYGLPGRIYHDWPHGKQVTHVVNKEIDAIREVTGLTREEEEHLRAIMTSGAIRHDMAYLSVDGGLFTRWMPSVKPYVAVSATEPFRVKIRRKLSRIGKDVVAVHGFTAGQTIAELPCGGLPGGANELLSSLATAHDFANGRRVRLGQELRLAIIEITAVTQATVPFVANKAQILYDRLVDLGLDERRAELAVMGAVAVANRDVIGFSGGDIDKPKTHEERFLEFVGGTWNILPENNTVLRDKNYTPEQFFNALKNSHHFLKNIVNPDHIFSSFHGFPSAHDMAIRAAWAKHNLALLDGYMTAKIVSAAIVRAVGSILDPSGKTTLPEIVDKMNTHLPPVDDTNFRTNPNDNADDIGRKKFERIIFNTLVERRTSTGQADIQHQDWDIKESPIARYLMQTIGMDGIRRIKDLVDVYMTKDKYEPGAFLEKIKCAEVDVVIKGMEEITAAKVAEPGPPDVRAGHENRLAAFQKVPRFEAVLV